MHNRLLLSFLSIRTIGDVYGESEGLIMSIFSMLSTSSRIVSCKVCGTVYCFLWIGLLEVSLMLCSQMFVLPGRSVRTSENSLSMFFSWCCWHSVRLLLISTFRGPSVALRAGIWQHTDLSEKGASIPSEITAAFECRWFNFALQIKVVYVYLFDIHLTFVVAIDNWMFKQFLKETL